MEYVDYMGCCTMRLGGLDNVSLSIEETEEPDINNLRLYIFDSSDELIERTDVLFRDVFIRGLQYFSSGDCNIWFDSNINYPFEIDGEVARLNTISSDKVNHFLINRGVLELS